MTGLWIPLTLNTSNFLRHELLTSHLTSLSPLGSFMYKMGMIICTSLDYSAYQIRYLCEIPVQDGYLISAGFLSSFLTCQWQHLSFSKSIKSFWEVCTCFHITGYFHGDTWSIYVSVWEGTVHLQHCYLSWRLSWEKENTPARHDSFVHFPRYLTVYLITQSVPLNLAYT